MKRLLIAIVAALPLSAGASFPAAALPSLPAAGAAAPLVIPVRHHRHHGHWRRYRHRWSEVAPYPGSPAMDMARPIIPGTAPPQSGSSGPPTNTEHAGSGGPPAIRWVDPAPSVR